MDNDAEIEHRLRDGVAVVTDACGGLGRALCLELAGRGVRVAGLGRQKGRLEQTAQGDTQGRVHTFVTDVSNAAAVATEFEKIRQELGPPTILIHNATVYPRRDFLDETPESFAQTMNVNLGGCVNCCTAVLPDMVAQGYGRILNVGSFADLHPAPVSAAYSVSKGAMRIFTKALVADLGDRFPDILINDWMLGGVEIAVEDGLESQISARWGVNLALWHQRDLNGAIFERDTEILPPLSFKRRLFNKLTRSGAQPRQLDS